MDNPVLIISTRGHYPESQHRGAVAVVNASGRILHSQGDIETPIFPRSAAKLFQILPFLECGALEAYHLGQEEIALACGSHNGDEKHVNLGEHWLKKINEDENVIACGIHRPMGHAARLSLLKNKKSPSVLHNACSGKHLGMITTALHRGEDIKDYSNRQHPVQKRIENVISEMTHFDTLSAPKGTDGCEIPVIGVPLYNIAWGMAQIADSTHLPYTRQKAILLMIESLKNHPDMIGGEGSLDTEIIKATQGRVIAKMGASGTYVALAPEQGLGIALKIDDGNIKAAEIALIHILEELGVIDSALGEQLGREKIISTYNNHPVGKIHPASKKKTF